MEKVNFFGKIKRIWKRLVVMMELKDNNAFFMYISHSKLNIQFLCRLLVEHFPPHQGCKGLSASALLNKLLPFLLLLQEELPQGGKSRAEAGVCAGTIPDPRGEFRQRGRPSVAPVTEDDGGIVASVSDGSSFGETKQRTCWRFPINTHHSFILLNPHL